MSDIADRYRRLAHRFTTVVDAVPDDGWGRPSPCEGWTGQEVLGHVVESEHGFLGRFELAPSLDGLDPLARWTAARDAMQAGLDDEQTATIEYDGMFGPTNFADTVDAFMCADLVIHAWDIARAAGLSDLEEMPADEVERLDANLRGMGDALRGPGAFGPELPVSDDAPAQARLLGFLGRHP